MPHWDEAERWLIALRNRELGGRGLRRAVEHYGGIEALFEAAAAGDSALPAACRHSLLHPPPEVLAADLEWLATEHHHLIVFTDPAYPPQLAECPGAPAALFVAGDPGILFTAQIAIVGSRNASAGGVAHARRFARELAAGGMTITSGLAAGIDAAAHDAALDAGGWTIAVLGTGADRVYPARHLELARRIVQHGALVSELPLGAPPLAGHFPARNRIISGLSLAVVVVEAGIKSGSLITARHAAEQGREVFAVPGSIDHALAKGCHQLIRDGAHLAGDSAAVLAGVADQAGHLAGQLRARLEAMDNTPPPAGGRAAAGGRHDDPEYRRLWAALGPDPAPLDELAGRSGLTVAALSSMLLILELEGRVVHLPGGLWQRAPGT